MVRVGEVNGAVAPHVDKETNVKIYNCFSDLIDDRESFPEAGWIFVDKAVNLGSKDSIWAASFFMAEDEPEELVLEKVKRTLVESPTLLDIISVLDKRSVKPTDEEYLMALLYYREYDDFQE